MLLVALLVLLGDAGLVLLVAALVLLVAALLLLIVALGSWSGVPLQSRELRSRAKRV